MGLSRDAQKAPALGGDHYAARMAVDGNRPGPLTYRSVHIGLRAPRVVIVVPGEELWLSHAANALYAASRSWGGSGYVLAPSGPDVPCVLLRAVAEYDPDYVVGLSYTNSDLWSLGLATPPINPSTDEPYEEQELVAIRDQVRFVTESHRIADATSVYRTDGGSESHRSVTALGPSKSARALREIPEPPTLAPVESAPSEPNGTHGLAMAMRLGFAHRPSMPYESEIPPDAARLGFDLVLRGQPTPRARGAFDDLPVSEDAWQRTEQGLGWISRRLPRPENLYVIGSTLNDFCLAICWDRMRGHSTGTWVPNDLCESEEIDRLGSALSLSALELERSAGRVLVTSCSLSMEEVQRIVDSSIEKSARSYRLVDDAAESASITVIAPDALKLRASHHLGFVPDGYDIVETLPVEAHPSGGLRLMAPIPAHVPEERVGAKATRPDWEVDVSLGDLPAPSGRGLSARALVNRDTDWTTVRAARAGFSFNAHDMGWVDAAASLAQSIARPELRYPGLRDWIGWMVSSQYTVGSSDKGRSAEISARLWGGRSELLGSFRATRPLLIEFLRKASSDSAFPQRDGLPVSGYGVVLTIDGCARALSVDQAAARDHVDRMVDRRILRRGVVLRCSDCFGRSFIAVDVLGQQTECPRCASAIQLVAGSWGDANEPVWYYSLHGAVRKLMEHNGDVPILGAAYLRKGARHYIDDSELELHVPGRAKAFCEIDLVAVADGEIVVGEAKRNPRKAGGVADLDKLIDVAALLRADVIALLSGEDGPWSPGQVSHLQDKMDRQPWIDGRKPRLTEVFGLTSGQGESRSPQGRS
jgi:hypothetical protein